MKWFKELIAAFQFLTVLPLPVRTLPEHMARSMVWFPLVGAVIGLATGWGYRLLSNIFPGTVAAVLTILLYILLTRGLHLDGFMDTVDGFFSHRHRQRILEIMKDPTVGSFAVLGSGIWFLVLLTSLEYLEPADHVMLHMTTRTAILWMPLFFSYPRESGTGKFFVENIKKGTVIVAMLFLAAIAAGFFYKQPLVPLVVTVVSLAAALFTGLWSRRKIGGITGDVLGFTIETTHMLLVLVIPFVTGIWKFQIN